MPYSECSCVKKINSSTPTTENELCNSSRIFFASAHNHLFITSTWKVVIWKKALNIPRSLHFSATYTRSRKLGRYKLTVIFCLGFLSHIYFPSVVQLQPFKPRAYLFSVVKASVLLILIKALYNYTQRATVSLRHSHPSVRTFQARLCSFPSFVYVNC